MNEHHPRGPSKSARHASFYDPARLQSARRFPPPRQATARPTGLAVTADGTLLVTCAEDNSVGISLIFIATGLVFVVIKR